MSTNSGYVCFSGSSGASLLVGVIRAGCDDTTNCIIATLTLVYMAILHLIGLMLPHLIIRPAQCLFYRHYPWASYITGTEEGGIGITTTSSVNSVDMSPSVSINVKPQ